MDLALITVVALVVMLAAAGVLGGESRLLDEATRRHPDDHAPAGDDYWERPPQR